MILPYRALYVALGVGLCRAGSRADGDSGTADLLRTDQSGPIQRPVRDANADIEPDADGDTFGDETQDLCPADASTQGACPPGPDVTDPHVALAGVPASMPIGTFLKGVKAKLTPDEAVALSGQLLATARTARISAFNLQLATKSAGLAAGPRTLKPQAGPQAGRTPAQAVQGAAPDHRDGRGRERDDRHEDVPSATAPIGVSSGRAPEPLRYDPGTIDCTRRHRRAVRRSRHAEAVRLVRRPGRGRREPDDAEARAPPAAAQCPGRGSRGDDRRGAPGPGRAHAGRGGARDQHHGHRDPQGARAERPVDPAERLRVQPRPDRRHGRTGRIRTGLSVRGPCARDRGEGHRVGAGRDRSRRGRLALAIEAGRRAAADEVASQPNQGATGRFTRTARPSTEPVVQRPRRPRLDRR